MAVVKGGLLAPLVENNEAKSAQDLSAVTGVEEVLIGKSNHLCGALIKSLMLNGSLDETINGPWNFQGGRTANLRFYYNLRNPNGTSAAWWLSVHVRSIANTDAEAAHLGCTS